MKEVKMRLAGKRAIVTGGGSGIGEATCHRLAREGVRVAVLDIDLQSAQRVASEIPGAMAVLGDVADSASVDRATAEVCAKFGGLEILVNNAGAPAEETAEALRTRDRQVAEDKASEPESTMESTVRMTDEQWRRELGIYLDGTFYCTRAALRVMLPQRQGSIVNISSIHGIAGGTGLPHYSAAKAGILGFTRSVAKEVASQGVRVNAVTPGYFMTPALEKFMPPGLQLATARMTPMKRLGEAEECAALVAFLASEDASYITGQTISPDGGWLTV